MYGSGRHHQALNGIRVLDFTRLLAGPYATRLLADSGAEVIKVQSRRTALGAEANSTPGFVNWNRGKLGITLDMSQPGAKKLALRLVAVSDVLVENFSPRVMQNWGLGYEVLNGINGRLVMASMSAMGHSGPWREFVALAPTIHAFSGMTYLTAYDKQRPVGPGFPHADMISGLYAGCAILSALESREGTGKGQHIDISEYEAECSLLGPALLKCTANRDAARPGYNSSQAGVTAAPHGHFRCQGEDSWCAISCASDDEWQAMCRVMKQPVWLCDERFADVASRQSHAAELRSLMEAWTTRHTAEEAMRLLQLAGVPCGVVRPVGDLMNDPQLLSEGFFTVMSHPFLRQVRVTTDRSAVRLSRTPSAIRKSAPLLGEDNSYVFGTLLGLPDWEIEELVAEGVIA